MKVDQLVKGRKNKFGIAIDDETSTVAGIISAERMTSQRHLYTCMYRLYQ